MKNKNIVVIGGGTGTFGLLQEFKNWTSNISVIVNMCDDGGSSGDLRDELGVLPPGDIRQCLVGLSNYPEARNLFSYRFGKGKLNNHSVGNIVLAALELYYGDFSKAVEVVSSLLKITGKVIPISTQKYQLCLVDNKKTIIGESTIANHQIQSKHPKLYLTPKVKINPEAKTAILEADLVVIAPGNFYGSILPILVVDGIKNALRITKAKVVMITNLVNKPKHTLNWTVKNYHSRAERYLAKNSIDYVLYNKQKIAKRMLDKYAQDKEFPIKYHTKDFENQFTKFIGADLVDRRPYKQDNNDRKIKRTLIRHNAKNVVKELEKILGNK